MMAREAFFLLVQFLKKTSNLGNMGRKLKG